MKKAQLPEIKLYVSFIRCLIRKFLLYPLQMIMFGHKDIGDLEIKLRDGFIFVGFIKDKKCDAPKSVNPLKAAGSHAPVYYSDPLLVTHTATRYAYLFWLSYRRHYIRYRMLHKCLASKTNSFFKQWNDSIHNHLTLLFGLSNIRPVNLYDAIFGSSSYRIH